MALHSSWHTKSGTESVLESKHKNSILPKPPRQPETDCLGKHEMDEVLKMDIFFLWDNNELVVNIFMIGFDFANHKIEV